MKNCSKQDHHDVLAKRGIIKQRPMFFITNSILGLGFKTGMMKAISSRIKEAATDASKVSSRSLIKLQNEKNSKMHSNPDQRWPRRQIKQRSTYLGQELI